MLRILLKSKTNSCSTSKVNPKSKVRKKLHLYQDRFYRKIDPYQNKSKSVEINGYNKAKLSNSKATSNQAPVVGQTIHQVQN